MKDEEGQESGFKIQDRRRFDSSGNLRGEGSEEKLSEQPQQPTRQKPASEQPDFVMSESESEEAFAKHSEASIDFSSFVLSLATQVMVQLGEMPAPGGAKIPKDVQAARQTIEILGMLQEKTKGNLSEPEKQMMEEILHNLRLTYVQKYA